MSNLLLEAAATRPQDDMAEVLASFQSLLMRPVASGLVFRHSQHLEHLQALHQVMQLLQRQSGIDAELASRLEWMLEPPGIGHVLRSAAADSLLDTLGPNLTSSEHGVLRLCHAKSLLSRGVATLQQRLSRMTSTENRCYDSLLRSVSTHLGGADGFWASLQLPLADCARPQLAEWLLRNDRFSIGATYRAALEGINQSPAAETRPLAMLYGYRQEKARFSQHFEAFAAGRAVPPLGLWGLPGLGKTHFAIAYARQFECVLVTADEKVLETRLERVLAELGRYSHRRFVLFFDDIEAESVDWGPFRHQVSGHLHYPINVLTILASNYPFPPSVRSRCALLPFRPIDPVVCSEIAEDYLHKQMCLSGDRRRLAQVIVADYVNEYVQHRISELSPRTLIRYLDRMASDADLRTRLLHESMAEPIRVPTADMFMESNKLLIAEMNIGRERYPWRPQDFHE